MFAREGYSTIAIVLIFGIVVSGLSLTYINHWAAYALVAAMIILNLFILYFFRDPDREVPEGNEFIIAPADGKVVLIKEIESHPYLEGRAKQISIFLSPLDVHVNRVPASGTIEYVKYHPGAYLMAWDERASSMNERADFGLKHPSGTKLFFRQITGFMARRIVYHLSEGDEVQAGSRFGMMKFGSRMDILLPESISINIEKGDKTVAGESIIARIPQKASSNKMQAQFTE